MCLSTSCPQSIRARDKPNLPPVGSTAHFRCRKGAALPPSSEDAPLTLFSAICVFSLPFKGSLSPDPTLPQLLWSCTQSQPSASGSSRLSVPHTLVANGTGSEELFGFFFPAWIGGKYSIGYRRFTLSSQLTGLAINSESSQYKPVTNEHWVTLVKY